MEFPAMRISFVATVLSAAFWSSLVASSSLQQQLGCEQLCTMMGEELSPPTHCACHNRHDSSRNTLTDIEDLQHILKKAAPHNKIFKWGRKRSIDDALDGASSDAAAYAPQTVQRRIFRWGKRSAPVQNQIFRWGKRVIADNDIDDSRDELMARRSPLPGYGDVTSTDVLRLEEAIRQGRMDYYDILAGTDVPVGKRRNMNPEMQNHIFKWGKRNAADERTAYTGDNNDGDSGAKHGLHPWEK